MKITIAIDGPAGAGKGTISRALAKKFNLAYLDTGTIYRAVTYSMLKDNIDINDTEKTLEYAQKLGSEIPFSILQSPDLRTDLVSNNVGKTAAMHEVRIALFDIQVNFANNPPEDKDGIILDGRDIASTICPNADVKLFITASPEIRAERRYKELVAKGEKVTLEQILKEINIRDARDENTSKTTLTAPAGSAVIDTSYLSIEEAIKRAEEVVNKSR